MQSHTRQADPNTVLPPAVREAAARAEALMKGQNEPAPNGGDPQPEITLQGNSAEKSPGEPQEGQEGAQSSQPTPAPQPAPAPSQSPGERIEPGSLEHQLAAANGRVKKYNETIQTMGEEIDNLRRLLAGMTQNQPASSQAVATFEAPEITPEEREQWGDELLKVIEKKAAQIAAPLRAQLDQRLSELDQKLGGVAQVQIIDARDRMMQTLDTSVPGWRETNLEDAFKEFLTEIDPLSGLKRQTMIMDAWNQNNAARVGAFFNEFYRQAGRQPDQSRNGLSRDPASQPAPQNPLEALAAPGKPRTAPTAPRADDDDVITRADVSRFYTDLAAGRFVGKEQLAKDYEKKIYAAQAKGTLR